MSVIFVVLPLAIVLAALAVWGFIWSVRSGQLDDLDTPSLRITHDDGAENLALAFFAAGVPTIVASLWNLDDRYSASLMPGFHRALAAGITPAAAIRDIVLKELHDPRRPRSVPPSAGIVIVGGSRQLVR